MRTIWICVIALAVLGLAAVYGAVHAKPGPTTDYFQRVAGVK